jgi:hypothetical protein
MKTKMFSIKRFGADQRGELPVELIVLSASVLLLGATYFQTQSSDVDAGISSASEEVFVRKCGHVRTVSTTEDLTRQPSAKCD